jgi:transmembrane sensor
VSTLGPPLRDHAPVPVDVSTSQRVWRGVVARRETSRERAQRRHVFAWFVVGAMAGAVLMLGVERLRGTPVADTTSTAGPLALSSGGALRALETPPDAASMETSFADGSKVALGPGARLEPLESTARSVVLMLASGRATFDVEPGGPRRWSVECGLATVEVVGTRFVITRSAERVLVEVERGTVLVRGERVPNRVQRLTAGSALEVLSPPNPLTLQATAPALPVAPSAVPADPTAPKAPAAAPRVWRDLATHGAYTDAYRSLGPSGMGAEVAHSASAQDLLALADVARLSGHAAEAVPPLTRVLTEHLDDSRAPIAAFTLGKLHLATLGQPAAAARDFSKAIALGLPSGLMEDAFGYLVEARGKAGDSAGARAAAESYRKKFPNSSRAESLTKWAASR